MSAAAGAPPHAPWAGVRRVLAVRLDRLGDVLMTTPALAALREGLPQATLTLLTSPGAARAAAHWPMLDEVWAAEVPWMPRAGTEAQRLGAAEAALVQRLADGRFDAAVIFTVCTQSALPAALLCRLAGIPRRLAHSRENPYGLLSDWVPDPDEVRPGDARTLWPPRARHEVERQLALVAAVGLHTADTRLRFALRESDRQEAALRLAALRLAPGRPLVLMHPGASAPSRRWPAERFGEVAARLLQAGCHVVFAGAPDETPLVEAALMRLAAFRPDGGPAVGASATADDEDAPRCASLAGALDLGALAGLIARADVLVANNSAPAHLAAAVGTPVASLYAMTNPQHTPWAVPHRLLQHDVPCRHCLRSRCPEAHHACLNGVEAPAVAAAVLSLLAQAPSTARTAAAPASPAPHHGALA